jgi:Haem-binding domain
MGMIRACCETVSRHRGVRPGIGDEGHAAPYRDFLPSNAHVCAHTVPGMKAPWSNAQGSLAHRWQSILISTTMAALVIFAASFAIGLNLIFAALIVALFAITITLLLRLRRRRTSTDDSPSVGALAFLSVVSGVAVFALIQAVPYGRSHSNGPVVAEPTWPDPQTRALAVRACYDCHSNEVKYPWYSNVAPISWLVAEHVSDGRAALNFSDIRRSNEGADNAVEVIQDGSMPPPYFTRFGLHQSAKLTKAEADALIAGLRKMPEFRER